MYYSDGNSRGFGFVQFAFQNSVKKLLSFANPTICGKLIECKIALNKKEAKCNIENEITKKIFVANLCLDMSEIELKEYFNNFGQVKSVRIVTNIGSNESRGFAFISYIDKES